MAPEPTTVDVEQRIAAVVESSIPCDEGFYWRRCGFQQYVSALKDGLGCIHVNVIHKGTEHFVFMLAERQGARRDAAASQ